MGRLLTKLILRVKDLWNQIKTDGEDGHSRFCYRCSPLLSASGDTFITLVLGKGEATTQFKDSLQKGLAAVFVLDRRLTDGQRPRYDTARLDDRNRAPECREVL